MYPSERLLDILENSEEDYEELLSAFTSAAFPDIKDEQLDDVVHEINSKGIEFSF